MQVVNEEAVKAIATPALAYRAMEETFKAVAAGEAGICPVVVAGGRAEASSIAIKTGGLLGRGLLGFKLGSYFPSNADLGKPCHQSATFLVDADTGFPRAVISGGHLNGLRTAAADAVAVNTLARTDAEILGVVGAGHQAAYDIRAIAQIRDLKCIKIWSRSHDRARGLGEQLGNLDVKVEFPDLEQTVRESDIVVTVTPSINALVKGDWLSPGTHISAMGSDQAGKRELDAATLMRASLFADLPNQSVKIGELQYLDAGQADTAVTAIGEVLIGRHPGRRYPEEITLFDSSGIAVQDLSIAASVLQIACDQGLAGKIQF